MFWNICGTIVHSKHELFVAIVITRINRSHSCQWWDHCCGTFSLLLLCVLTPQLTNSGCGKYRAIISVSLMFTLNLASVPILTSKPRSHWRCQARHMFHRPCLQWLLPTLTAYSPTKVRKKECLNISVWKVHVTGSIRFFFKHGWSERIPVTWSHRYFWYCKLKTSIWFYTYPV